MRPLPALGLLQDLLPPGVAAYDTETRALPGSALRLLPEEAAGVRRAVAGRRREFAAGRHCARRALAVLGHAAADGAPIPAGPDRAPCWPAGVVGSITHAAGYCAAAVAADRSTWTLGVDAEPDEPLPADVLPIVAGAPERRHLAALRERDPEPAWDRLLFSAKESVYKAWFPRARCWLGFDEAEVTIGPGDGTAGTPDGGTFTAVLAAGTAGLPLPGGGTARQVRGRWRRAGGMLLTAVTIPVAAPADVSVR